MTSTRLTLCPQCSRLRVDGRPCPYCRRRQEERERWAARALAVGCGVLGLVLLALVLSSCAGVDGAGGSAGGGLSMREKRATVMAGASAVGARGALDARRAPGATGDAESDFVGEKVESGGWVELAPLPPCEVVATERFLGKRVTWPGRGNLSGSRLPCR